MTATDKALAEKSGGTAELGYSQSVIDKQNNAVVLVNSYDEKNTMNKLEVVSGRLPQNDEEIVLDDVAQKSIKIGQTYTLDKDTLNLSRGEYKVVGFVRSPAFIDDGARGTTNVGSGTINYFAYVPVANFKSDSYSTLYLSFPNLKSKNSFLAEYKDVVEAKQDDLKDAFSARKDTRLAELKQSGNDELAPQLEKITDGQKKLTAGFDAIKAAQDKLTAQAAQLASQKMQLTATYGADVATEQLKEATAQLTAAQTQLDSQKSALTTQQEELTANGKKLTDAQNKIDDLEAPTYYINVHTDNPGVAEYDALTNQINAIANIFPVFFFLIAILITFTTMTRMIEEKRQEIGTLKALGYRKTEIAIKYLLYALFATLLGVTAGVVIGSNALPYIAFAMFKDHYIFKTIVLSYHWLFILLATLASLVATIGALAYILRKELKEKPAALMQAKAPKGGQRIFLEHFKRLWSRLNFNQKVSYRNLFRYKARMIVTIVGIAGCTGLMLAGFGLKESIGAPVLRQTNDITRYQGVVTLADKKNDTSSIENVIKENTAISGELPAYQQQITMKKKGVDTQNVTFTVPENAKTFGSYVKLKNTSSKKIITLPGNGAVVSAKLAKLFAIKVGDTIELTVNKEPLKIKVAAIAEYYLGHAIWLSKAYYEDELDKTFLANSFLIKTDALTNSQQDTLATDLNETGDVINTTFIQSEMKKQLASTDNLGPIVWIFIILSGTLAFVVLYNLTNINISERVRELATIKVLGFYNGEVTMYILRENLIFTLLGIILGFGIGNILTYAIIKMAETAEVVFPLVVPLYGYVVSGVLTFAFSAIVLFATHFKLKKINMIEALKSNE